MKLSNLGLISILLMVVSGVVPLNAAIIDFEDIGVGVGANDIAGDRVSGGFIFDSSVDHTHIQNASFGGDNGSSYLVTDIVGNVLTMSASSGSAFSLLSLDIAENLDPYATEVTVTGSLVGGGSVSETITLDNIFDNDGPLVDFEVVNFDGSWTNLTQVAFEATAGSGRRYFSLDNINVGPAIVPEPSVVALFAAGLFGLGFARSRMRS